MTARLLEVKHVLICELGMERSLPFHNSMHCQEEGSTEVLPYAAPFANGVRS